jgi:hypothetical protein
MGFMDKFFGNMFDQFPFHRQRRGGGFGYQAQAMAYTKHMGIHRHIGLPVDDGCYHIRRLSAHTG